MISYTACFVWPLVWTLKVFYLKKKRDWKENLSFFHSWGLTDNFVLLYQLANSLSPTHNINYINNLIINKQINQNLTKNF